jgi:hypothetical protein
LRSPRRSAALRQVVGAVGFTLFRAEPERPAGLALLVPCVVAGRVAAPARPAARLLELSRCLPQSHAPGLQRGWLRRGCSGLPSSTQASPSPPQRYRQSRRSQRRRTAPCTSKRRTAPSVVPACRRPCGPLRFVPSLSVAVGATAPIAARSHRDAQLSAAQRAAEKSRIRSVVSHSPARPHGVALRAVATTHSGRPRAPRSAGPVGLSELRELLAYAPPVLVDQARNGSAVWSAD